MINFKNFSERNLKLLLSIATSVLGKFIAIGVTLITIPVTLDYLGVELFGVWMVISSVISFMAFSDLGFGMGLQNALSRSCGEDNKDIPKVYIANAYLLIMMASFIFVFIILLMFELLPINSLFKGVKADAIDSSILVLKYTLIAFFLCIPAYVIQRVLTGIQKAYISNNIMMIAGCATLLSVILAVNLDLGLVGLAVLYIVTPAFVFAIYTVWFFNVNPIYMPRVAFIKKNYMKEIASTGGWMVILQIIYTIKMNAPILLVSAVFGVIAVGEFSIAQKLTGLASTLISLALQPLWAVYGEAYYKNDKKWIITTLKKSTIIVISIGFISGVFLNYCGEYLVIYWLDDDIVPSQTLIACFAVWMIVSSVNVSFTMLMNGTGYFKLQSAITAIGVSTALVCVYFFSVGYGLFSVILMMCIFSELLVMPFYFYQCIKVIRSINTD